MSFHKVLVKSSRFTKHIFFRFDISNKQGLNILSKKNKSHSNFLQVVKVFY